jgi:hypothetical protein
VGTSDAATTQPAPASTDSGTASKAGADDAADKQGADPFSSDPSLPSTT